MSAKERLIQQTSETAKHFAAGNIDPVISYGKSRLRVFDNTISFIKDHPKFSSAAVAGVFAVNGVFGGVSQVNAVEDHRDDSQLTDRVTTTINIGQSTDWDKEFLKLGLVDKAAQDQTETLKNAVDSVVIEEGESITAAVSRTFDIDSGRAYELVNDAGYGDKNLVYKGDKFEFKGQGAEEPNTEFDAGANKDNADLKPEKDEHEEFEICHRTDAVKNPYNTIKIDRHAVDGIAGNSGGRADHFGEHQGPIASSESIAQDLKNNHIEWGDIIPPVEGFHDGANWPEGKSIFDNDCQFPEATKTPEPSPSVSATSTVEITITPTVTPAATSTETPTATSQPTETVSPAPTQTEVSSECIITDVHGYFDYTGNHLSPDPVVGHFKNIAEDPNCSDNLYVHIYGSMQEPETGGWLESQKYIESQTINVPENTLDYGFIKEIDVPNKDYCWYQVDLTDSPEHPEPPYIKARDHVFVKDADSCLPSPTATDTAESSMTPIATKTPEPFNPPSNPPRFPTETPTAKPSESPIPSATASITPEATPTIDIVLPPSGFGIEEKKENDDISLWLLMATGVMTVGAGIYLTTRERMRFLVPIYNRVRKSILEIDDEGENNKKKKGGESRS